MPGIGVLIDGADVFLDTNILIYAAQGGEAAPAKRLRARQIVLEEDYCTSAQVLAEFYINVVRRGERPLAPEKAGQWVRAIAKKPCLPIDASIVADAIALSRHSHISYWDAAIVAAAQRLGSRILYTEDLNHGQTYGSVRTINPFL